MSSRIKPFGFPRTSAAACIAVALGAGLTLPALAQSSAGKTVVVEPTNLPPVAPVTQVVLQPEAPANTATLAPFAAFTQWIQVISAPLPIAEVSVPVVEQPFQPTVSTAETPFEAAPVILGQPELPLLGQAAARAAQQWNSGLNYQGANIAYLVLNASGREVEVRPVSRGLVPGERFKIRYTTSFDAVASLDRVIGDSPWTGRRVGQAWPQSGMAIQSAPGETVEIPLEAGSYFRFDGNPNERLVLSVRHPQAKGAARSNQPAYRQDGAKGSQYLQLVPTNTLPAIEQILARAPRGLTRVIKP